jgi:phage shock protein C
MSTRRSKFYLDKQHAKFMGVCSGLADHFGIDALWLRVAAVLMVFFGFGLLIPIYLAVGFMADKKPSELYLEQAEERKWAQKYAASRRSRDVDHRMADLDAYYMSSNPRLSSEIDKLA